MVDDGRGNEGDLAKQGISSQLVERRTIARGESPSLRNSINNKNLYNSKDNINVVIGGPIMHHQYR